MVYFKTSILLHDDSAGNKEKTGEKSLISSSINNNNNNGDSKSSATSSGIVFRSLCVDKTSKTPYSDATQVGTDD